MRKNRLVVIYKIDRLSRSLADFVRLMDGIMIVVMISERTKAALAAVKAQGKQLGLNGHRLALVNRASAMKFAETMRGPAEDALAGGANTLAEIASVMNSDGLRTRQGCKWSASGVHRLLHRLEMRPESADKSGAG